MTHEFLASLGIEKDNPGTYADGWREPSGEWLESISPHDGSVIGRVAMATPADYEASVVASQEAFKVWRLWPAPKRGELVRRCGEALRKHKQALGDLVSLEMGKIRAEGAGEVQEMIDIADFSVGLSRQLYGKTMPSERPGHRMYEQWHPLGVVGCISAFNFPVAVWSWNAMVAAVCGDSVLWKPSDITPLCAVAVQRIIEPVMKEMEAPSIFNLVIGSVEVAGEPMIADRRIPLISATGSCRMGRRVAEVVGARLGRSLLELGGNNGLIITENADLELAMRATLFGAVGTAGQRCTSTRRVFLHKSIASRFTEKLQKAYTQVPIGNPLDEKTLMGPLIHGEAVAAMQRTLKAVAAQGGEVIAGGKTSVEGLSGHYVEPTLVRIGHDAPIVQEETFAPILYLIDYDDLEAVIDWHNAVPQGLSSAIFTQNMLEAEKFLSHAGSDCGIANVNIGTSGAEIGGAFGGEKETGGGREAGSDSWQAYMRRQTNTINGSKELPLAQGIRFGD